ncbi:MAG: SAM-dependent methyltransferase [Bacteroides sp.]|nr:SAM-dependent methyltransferase [Bacteroides sp.]MCM1084881.1 SAM-dependent methyltransferase [Bacteroides sp.]
MKALEAQRLAHEISFGPVIFQISRLMVKWGIFQMLIDAKDGLTLEEIEKKTGLTPYAVQILIYASLTAGTVLCDETGRYTTSKAGWFLLNDPLVKVDMGMVHNVIYKGLFHLEETLLTGEPVGLREVFGDYTTIYEALSSLPPQVQKSWFDWDHYFSDQSFGQALPIVFANRPKTLLDVGGNTGKFALRCVDYDKEVRVTIVDLPQQLGLMKDFVAGKPGCERISGHPVNLLDQSVKLPIGFDAVWMSQLISAFSEEEVTRVLARAAEAMAVDTPLYINETLWDRQRFDVASYCLTQTTAYFACLANGNSKMYHSKDLLRCIGNAGLKVETIYDGLGKGHSLLVCKKCC